MKILIHIPQLIYGGAEKVLVDFTNYLVGKGHDVEILETYEKGFLKSEFVEGVKFNAICSKEYTEKYYVSLEDIKKERNILKKIKLIAKKVFITCVGYEKLAVRFTKKFYNDKEFDIAINYLETQSPKFILENISAKKYLQWIHTDVSKSDELEFLKDEKICAKIDKFICVSKYSKKQFENKYLNLSLNTEVIYNFYNSKKIIELANSKKNIYSDEFFYILSVGRLVDAKGYARALEVFSKLKTEGFKFKYYIIGDGILKDKLLSQINELGLTDEVKLLGIKENPYPYIKQCDLFLLPSLFEGFPTVTIEALILNKYILATEVAGIHEQIYSTNLGKVVENNEISLYEGLKTEINNGKTKEVKKEFSLDIIDNNWNYDKFLSFCAELE